MYLSITLWPKACSWPLLRPAALAADGLRLLGTALRTGTHCHPRRCGSEVGHCVLPTHPSPLSRAMEVGHRVQLLFDPALVARADPQITRTVHQAATLPTPVLAPELKNTWENGGVDYSKRVTLYGTVLPPASSALGEELGLYKMWYMCRMGPPDTSPPHRIPELFCPRDDSKPPTFEGATSDQHGRAFV